MLTEKTEAILIRAAYALKEPAEITLGFLNDIKATDISGWTEQQRHSLDRAITFAEMTISLVDFAMEWEKKWVH